MSVVDVGLLVISAALFGYLLFALIHPEKF
jgi:K+-transporting ATPase KdpF subunit